MSSTCQIIHYDASQYRVYTCLQFCICNTKVAMARAELCVVLCAVYWPVSSSGYIPWSFPPSLSHFLPRSSLAHLPRSVAPSLVRSLPPSPLSLAPSMPTFLPHSLPSSTLPPFLHSRSHPPAHHRFLTPSLIYPPLASSFPSSILSRSFPSVWIVCVFGKLHCIVAPSHVWHWDSGVFAPEEGVVSMGRCYLQRTCSHHESVFDEE